MTILNPTDTAKGDATLIMPAEALTERGMHLLHEVRKECDRMEAQYVATKIMFADFIAETALWEAARMRTLASFATPGLGNSQPSSASRLPGYLLSCRPRLGTGRAVAWLQDAVSFLRRHAQ